MKLRRLSTILLSGLVLLSSVVSAAAGDQPLATLAENSSLDRTREPVVVTGVFPGKPVEEIFVYGWNAGSWEQIPFQVDERDASGELVDVEDGVMDENDDVVFMAGDLGDQPGVPIGFELPVGDLWFQVEVSDPLDPGSKGWATVVHSRVLSVTNPTDYIDFDPVNKRIISSDYGLGWATAASVPPGQGQHNGLDYMSLFGGPDILDRTKIRIDYRFIILIQLTEEWFPPNDIELVKDGPVRVLVKRGPTTTEGYRSFVRTAFPIDLSSLPGTLEHVRTSADLVEGVTGTYYDENNAGGVAIDGVPDSVQPTPFNQAWRQVTVGDGSNIQMASLDELGGTPYHYYQDDSTGDGDDTGDLRSFGDSGFGVTNPGSENFSLVTGQFFIPASEGNQGATYYEYFQDPLEVSAVPVRQYKTYLPLQIKE